VPVNSTHPEYDANLPGWLRARDIFVGEDAVKAADKYLPLLDLQDDKDYLAYKTRASFFNASARTADGFVGLIFRHYPTFKLPGTNNGVSAAQQHYYRPGIYLRIPAINIGLFPNGNKSLAFDPTTPLYSRTVT
jgi:hypothetical protein